MYAGNQGIDDDLKVVAALQDDGSDYDSGPPSPITLADMAVNIWEQPVCSSVSSLEDDNSDEIDEIKRLRFFEQKYNKDSGLVTPTLVNVSLIRINLFVILLIF